MRIKVNVLPVADNYDSNKVGRSERVPRFNKETGEFEVEEARWDTFVKEAEEINKERGFKPGDMNHVTPQEAFLYATTETQEKIAKGWALNYGGRARYNFEDLKKLKKAKEVYEKLEKSIPEEERWKIMIQDEGLQGMRITPGLIPNETKNPTEVLDKAIMDANEQIQQSRDMVSGQLQQALQQKIQRENVTTTEKYAKQKTMKGYAEAGIEAMRQTKYNPYAKRDVFVAPENIFPEMGYGSHPEELIELVKDGRKAMVKRLTEKEIEKSLLERSTEGQTIGRAETEIMAKTATSTNFRMTAQGSFSLGIGSLSSTSEFAMNQSQESSRNKKTFNEATKKSSEKIRQEREVQVEFTESSEFSTSATHEINNPNNELTVTYLLYELERRYFITSRLHRVTPVIMVAMDIPGPHEITEAWVLEHAWILRRSLLDDSFLEAIDIIEGGTAADSLDVDIQQANWKTHKGLVDRLEASLQEVMSLRDQRRSEFV